MRVSLFGDDRDNLLARWNLLQASWGVGKAFYAQNQAPLSLNNENPLCQMAFKQNKGFSLFRDKEA